MPPLTRGPRTETIRKLAGAISLGLVAGCATPGPNHLYLTTAAGTAVQDLGPAHATLANVLKPDEHAAGLAYDFNTDHLFVRVAPAQVIRVIERPSGKILREMPLPDDLRGDGALDLAVRSGDRHLFAVHPDGRSVVELTAFGQFIRRMELAGLGAPIAGLAFDQQHGRLLVLARSSPATISAVSLPGVVIHYMTTLPAVNPVSLGYDSDAQHFFVPLADGHAVGEFDARGRLVATIPGRDPITAIDAGPRSFVRIF